MPVTEEPQGFTAEEQALFDKLNIGKEGGLPLPTFIRPSEVVGRSRPLADSIFKNWALLKAIVERHEGALLDRWKALKKKKRRDMLLAAWPDMAKDHRPDIVCWRDTYGETNRQAAEGAERDAFLWPNINLHDLSGTRPLWLLLVSRGRNAPDVFAASDLDSIKFGKACLALMPRYLNQYSMLFTERTTPETYGQLYAWNDIPSGERSLFENRGTHPGEGLWILEIQARLYAFLVDMAKRILPNAMASLADDNKPHPGTRHLPTTADRDFQDLPTLSLESPYTLPAPFSIQALLNLAYAKLWESEDHLWALREDPAYFAAALHDWRQHRREMLQDTDGNPHPSLSPRSAPLLLWARTVGLCVKRALEQVETWNVVYSKAHLVAQRLQQATAAAGQGKQLDPDEPLPRDLALALYSLYHHLRQLQNEPVGNLKIGCFASPPLRTYFRIQPPAKTAADGGDSDTTTSLTTAEQAPSSASTRELIWALGALQSDSSRQLLGVPALLDSIELLLQQKQQQQTSGANADSDEMLLSGWVAAQLGDLGVYAECVREVERLRPWAAGFEAEMQQDRQVGEILDVDFQKTLQRLRPLVQHEVRDRVASLAVPDDGRFAIAVDGEEDGGKRQAVAAERALDAFWGKLQQNMEKHGALTPRVKEVLTKMPVQRTGQPEVRTRTVAVAAAAARTSKKKALVDKRALRTFRALFPPSDAAGKSKSWTAGEAGWPDFVHAMRSAGFDITRLYGSAWLFVPAKQAGNASSGSGHRPILFQQPWPGVAGEKMSPSSARWLGKRLNRAFGWTRETFEAGA